MDYQIIKNSSSVLHNTSKRTGAIKYIVIHYTADSGATGANEITYFSRKTTTKASADLFVDFDGTIYQYNNDLTSRYTWHCGGSKLNSHGIMHGIVKNSNSVSIEMCCTKTDAGWTITNETYNATVWLARLLRYICGIPAGNVYRHYDVTGKLCPNIINFIYPNDTQWRAMKSAIDSDSQDTSADIQPAQDNYGFKVNTNYKVIVKAGLNVRKNHSTSAKRVRVYRYGTVFTCKDIYHATDGRLWLRTPSGWVCTIDKDGSRYAG